MIWDCILYNGEKDCLQIRGEELKDLDITHVLIESCFTFSGKSNTLKYWDFANLYSYNIKPFLCNNVPNNGDAWSNEKAQRNYILKALESLGAKDDDIVIISDADEIPKCEAVKKYNLEMGITALVMDLYYYYLNCLYAKQVWAMPKILTYEVLKNSTPDLIRKEGYRSMIQNGGWHFSYLGGVDAIREKIKSFSHTEFNVEPFNNEAYILEKIKNFEYLWGDKKLTTVEIDNSYPSVVFNNQSEYFHLIKAI